MTDSKIIPPQGASLPVCCITGRIAGDGFACGDCDPCSAAHRVPEVVKALIKERDDFAGKYEDAMMKLDAASAAQTPPSPASTEPTREAMAKWEREWPDKPSNWYDSEARVRLFDLLAALTHPAPAAQQASGQYDFPYQRTFDAIAAATEIYPSKEQALGFSISVRKFQEAFNNHRDARPLSTAPAAQQNEPVAWREEQMGPGKGWYYDEKPWSKNAQPLYAAPPAPSSPPGMREAWQPIDAPSVAQINSACLSYRHDFGLLDEAERQKVKNEACWWLDAWRKEGFGCDSNEVIERCAAVVDQANREGPYQAIAAASRIRALKTFTPPSPEPTGMRETWQPIETAPKDGTYILAAIDWLPYAKVLFWATYANEWRCPASEDKNGPYLPTYWMPLPTPPSPEPAASPLGEGEEK